MADERIYDRISKRTNGQIYIGVCGPVRTGKSTFIKRFMQLMVLPAIDNEYIKERVIDALPQSGDGRTITTAEPKFVPEDGVEISIGPAKLKIRMADCPGYPVEGALGMFEEGRPRMVKTPWDDEPVAFERAAVIGTRKIICDHSTVAVMITGDGDFTGLQRENYIKAEEQSAAELKALNKPFCIVLNCMSPESADSQVMAKEIATKYNAPCIPCDCKNMTAKDVSAIFDALLMQFPLGEVYIDLPQYMNALKFDHPVKKEIISTFKEYMDSLETVRDASEQLHIIMGNPFVKSARVKKFDLSSGKAYLDVKLSDELYYNIIGEILNEEITCDMELFSVLTQFSEAKSKFDELKDALEEVENKGYSMVYPKLEKLSLDKPELFRQGSKHGVRMVAKAPCLHLIKTDITTEISPVVGSLMQSEDLARYLNDKMDKADSTDAADSKNPNSEIWNTNLFGKTIQEMAMEQMKDKIEKMPNEMKSKIQRSLQKISNEGKDYFICIII